MSEKTTWKNDNTYIPLSMEMEAIVGRAAVVAMKHAGKPFEKLHTETQDLLRLQALVEAGKRRRRLPTFSVARALRTANQQFGDITEDQARSKALDLLIELRGMSHEQETSPE